MRRPSPPPTWVFLREGLPSIFHLLAFTSPIHLCLGSPTSKGSSPVGSEEADQLHPSVSPTSAHLGPMAAQAITKSSQSKKRPVPPSPRRPATPPATSNKVHQPLFLPDSDEDQGPRTSMGTPLFLPEGEGERPQRKKRRISSKATQSRTLDDLWRPRQVSGIPFISWH